MKYIILIAYLIGYILSYYWIRYLVKQDYPNQWGWSDIFINSVLSLAYPITIFVGTIMWWPNKWKSNNKFNPPKWL